MKIETINGCIKNNKIIFNKNINCINDDKIFIAVDGKTKDDYLEKIRKMYIKYNEKFVNRIEDFISIYLYDKVKHKLLLITDRMGVKPIYYRVEGNSIYFGRDLMDITNSYNLSKEINIDALSMYFRYNYIPTPQTILVNTYKLEHGHYLVYEKNTLKNKTYWDLIEIYNNCKKNQIKDLNECKKQLDELLNRMIKEIIDHQNNFGTYLSRGIDSSLVTAISSKYSNNPINTFSIGFHETKYNEAPFSKEISKYIGTKHNELYIDEKTILQVVRKIPEYYTEPFADNSTFATIVLNEFAKRKHIKVAITGDGADQLFCGAALYDKIRKIQILHYILNPFNIELNSKFIKNNKILKCIFANSDKRYQAQSNILYNEEKLDGLFIDRGDKRFEFEDKINTKNWQEKRMILDLNTFMADRVVNKMSTAANKNNIEIISPFLNSKFIEFSFRIPHKFKYYKKIKKYILKEILFNYVPKEYYDNKKRGFGIPYSEWLKTSLNEDLKRLSSKKIIEKQSIFNYNKIANYIQQIDKYENIIWEFYIFQLWYEKYFM